MNNCRMVYFDTACINMDFWENKKYGRYSPGFPYMSNGRGFTKNAFRVLSTLRVSSMNYYLVCSLPIHTRSSAIAEGPRAHCQLKSCKILNKCLTYCTWKGLQPVNAVADPGRMRGMRPHRPQLVQNFLNDYIWACIIVNVLTTPGCRQRTPVDVNNKSIFH